MPSHDLPTMLEHNPYDPLDYTFEDVRMRQIAPKVAVVIYKVKESLVVDGEHLVLEACDSTVWVREDGGWVSALHTEGPAGDPFGRR